MRKSCFFTASLLGFLALLTQLNLKGLEMYKKLLALFATTIVIATLAGCATTSVMGSGFESLGKNTYVVKIGTGGGILDQAIAAENAALTRLDEEAKKFMAQNKKFSNYQVVKSDRSRFPLTYYEYTVEFK